MMDVSTTSRPAQTSLPGRLYYLMGASGAGKDTLLNAYRLDIDHGSTDSHADALPAIIAHRYITRPTGHGNENHIALSDAEFAYRQQRGLFAMAWHRHETYYGIGIEIEQWLARGVSVLVNGSRAYLFTAWAAFPALIPILVRVDITTLRERLTQRGRENPEQIEQRLIQAQRYADLSALTASQQSRLRHIDNNSTIAEAVAQLHQILSRSPLADPSVGHADDGAIS